MIPGVRYGHTNIIARDWRSLASFYERVFGCVPVPPLRSQSGQALQNGTGVQNASLEGVHLRLPGVEDSNPEADGSSAGQPKTGPTLEIFTYGSVVVKEGDSERPANRVGFGHLAFAVDDVRQAQEIVLAEGGMAVGETASVTNSNGKTVTFCYVRDPEGNIIELQSWS